VSFNKTDAQFSQVVMRGISTGQASGLSQTPVGFFVDEVAVSDYFWNISTLDLTPFDLERVEVLRGPQGSLFGAATLGGAIRYITNKPDLQRFEGALNLSASTIASGSPGFLPQAMFNLPLAEGKFAVRGVLSYTDDGGYVDNLATGEEDWDSSSQVSGRLLARWQISDDVRLDATYISQDTDIDGTAEVAAADGPDFDNPTNPLWRVSEHSVEQRIGNLGVTWDLGFATLLSSSSYVEKQREGRFELGSAYAYDATTTYELLLMSLGVPVEAGDLSSTLTESYVGPSPHENEIFTQEFRLTSDSTGALDWIVGAYYTDVDSRSVTDAWIPGIESAVNGIVPGFGSMLFPGDVTTLFDARQTATEWALYGELGLALAKRWKLTAGGRFFDFSSDTDGTILSFGTEIPVGPFDASEDGFMPKVSLAFDANESLLWYALASRGYRVGGANVTAALAPPSSLIPLTYQTDKLWNYETGIKTAWLEGRLLADVTVFYIDWSDIQLNGSFAVPEVPGATVMATLNTGAAHSLGIEGALRAQLAPGLNLDLSLAWTEAELDEDSVPILNSETGEIVVLPAGSPLPSTPEWSGNVSLSYFLDNAALGYPSMVLSYTYKGSIVDGIPQLVELPSFSLVDLRLSTSLAPRLNVSLAASNLLDKRSPLSRDGPVAGTVVPEVYPEAFYITRPRTVSLTLQTRF